MLEILLSRSKLEDMILQDSGGNTPLHLSAIAMNNTERCVKELLENSTSAYLAIQNNNGETPLHMVLVGDSDERTNNEEEKSQFVHPLWQAEEKVVMLLVAKMGAEALGLRDVHGFTALSRASFSNSFSANSDKEISLLVAKMHLRDLALPERYGRTSLHIASGKGHTCLVRLLLDRGADTEIQNRWGDTVLLDTVRSESWPDNVVVEMLLTHGANVNAANYEGWTALHYAITNGNGDLVAILLDAGAEVEAKTRLDYKPMHFAVKEENGVLQDLLRAGADPHTKLRRGESPLHYAVYAGQMNNLRSLLQSGANPFVLDGLGRTSMDWALQSPTMKEIMLPYCKDYTPTDPAVTTRILRRNIARIISKLLCEEQASDEDLDFSNLGRSLVLLADLPEACTAYERDITKHTWMNEPVHPAICDSDSCSRNGSILGARYVCLVCPDKDFCSNCVQRYKNETLNECCQGHGFLVVPGENYESLAEGKVNEAGETKEEWLGRLARTYREEQLANSQDE